MSRRTIINEYMKTNKRHYKMIKTECNNINAYGIFSVVVLIIIIIASLNLFSSFFLFFFNSLFRLDWGFLNMLKSSFFYSLISSQQLYSCVYFCECIFCMCKLTGCLLFLFMIKKNIFSLRSVYFLSLVIITIILWYACICKTSS